MNEIPDTRVFSAVTSTVVMDPHGVTLHQRDARVPFVRLPKEEALQLATETIAYFRDHPEAV